MKSGIVLTKKKSATDRRNIDESQIMLNEKKNRQKRPHNKCFHLHGILKQAELF